MAQRPEVAKCARYGGTTVGQCLYLHCKQKKECIERPGTVVKMFKRMSKLEPSPFRGVQPKGRKKK